MKSRKTPPAVPDPPSPARLNTLGTDLDRVRQDAQSSVVAAREQFSSAAPDLFGDRRRPKQPKP